MLTPKGHYRSIRDWILHQKHQSLEHDAHMVALPLEPGARYLINPGSIGQPRDGDWRAAFAIFDDAERQVEYYRSPYNLFQTQEKMEKAGLPEPLVLRLTLGR